MKKLIRRWLGIEAENEALGHELAEISDALTKLMDENAKQAREALFKACDNANAAEDREAIEKMRNDLDDALCHFTSLYASVNELQGHEYVKENIQDLTRKLEALISGLQNMEARVKRIEEALVIIERKPGEPIQ